MNRLSGGVMLCVVFASVMACGKASGPTGNSPLGVISAFHDGAWVLAVDRALPSGGSAVGSPAIPLLESDFVAVTGDTTYRLELSEQGARIVTAEPHMVGRLEDVSADRLTYGLVEGTFAGGRIVVWQSSGGLQGELAIYGSGVPVIRSERGSLHEAW
jgi:hypothetical protein